MRRALVFLLLALSPVQSWAAVTIDQSTSFNTGTGTTTTVAFAATVAANPQGYLLVGLCTENGASDEVTAATFDGDALTQITRVNSTGGGLNAYLYARVAPEATTGQVSFTLSVARRAVVGVLSLHSVHQATPVDAAVTSVNAADTTTLTVSPTAETGSLLVDVMCKRSTNEALTMTAQTNRVQREADETTAVSANNDVVIGMSTRTGAGALTMDWSWLTNNRAAALIGIDVNPAAAAATGTSLGMHLLRR